MKTKAAVTYDQGAKFEISEVELKEPKANEVLIKVVASGVCHTDAVARDQDAPVPLPAVLGHEGSGIVEKVGEGVRSVEEGDHVVLSYSSCGQCENCLMGRPAYCHHMMELNFGGIMPDGTHRLYEGDQELSTFFGQSSFGTYAVAHERNVVKVDKDVELELLGPLGCGIQTGAGTVLNKLKPQFGETIAVFGCGAVGLSAIMAAGITSASEIIAIDVHDSRLELAKSLGATHTINGKQEEDVVEKIKELSNGGVHYSVETTSVPGVTRQSVLALRSLGVSAVVGVTPDTTFNVFEEIMAEGKSLIGAIEGDSVPQLFIPKLVDYYKQGRFPFDKLVKYYNLEEINEAFDDSANGQTVKPILKMDHAE
ncbi:NAD(P)-dependent alcohol dehydrogenase [Salimicrobium halophilum]|uniref:Aryl-alcohol dehydrogenase n=1 Tax=Salimicrobium halophilum TaxID=86666 RepID=A0A1G8R6L5_9BACI|nr:NAD(P)-dependent alcohol dehydrogenase [Salimicrobium halophilum]SDJ12626.1 aryl-alcohol dehydrogenase [Salimicrobium halophilum]